MKQFLLSLAGFMGWIWRVVPARWRINWLTAWFVLDSRGNPAMGLRQLLLLRDRLDWVINERAMAYGQGEHPKHRLTDYHGFFIDRIKNGERVLDVGCGYGAVARSIANAHPDCIVTGIDQDRFRLNQAKHSENPANLTFIEGDATYDLPPGGWDVVVLSNVLEHISNRVDFLRNLQAASGARRYLIRVPLFERDWQMALRYELGVDFRSDPDHKIEHKLSEFYSEMSLVGLIPIELITLWGEIWADCRPIGT